RALVDESEDAPLDDFFVRNLAAFDAGAVGGALNKRGCFGIGRLPAIVVVLGPTAAGFLPETALFAKFVGYQWHARSGLRVGRARFANQPADIETRKIVNGQWTHGHAKVVQSLIHLLDGGA